MIKKLLKESLQKLAGIKKPLLEQQTWMDAGLSNGWPASTIYWANSDIPGMSSYDGPNIAITGYPQVYDYNNCSNKLALVSPGGFGNVFNYILQNDYPLDTPFLEFIFKSGGVVNNTNNIVNTDEYEAGYNVAACRPPGSPGLGYRYIKSRHMFFNGESIPNRTSIQAIYDAILQYSDVTQEQLDQVQSYDDLTQLLQVVGSGSASEYSLTFACLAMTTGGCGGSCVCQCMEEDNCAYEEPIYGCMDPEASNYMPEANMNPWYGSEEVCQYIEGCTDNTAINYDEEAVIDDGSCTYQQDFCYDYAATLLQTEIDNVAQDTINTICTNFCQPVSGTNNEGDPYTFDWMSYGSAQYAGETGGPTGEIENPLLYQFCTEGCCDFEYSGTPEEEETIDEPFEWTGCDSFEDWLESVSAGEGISEEVFCNNCFENTTMGDAQQLWGEFFSEQCSCCEGWEEHLLAEACGEIPSSYLNTYCNADAVNVSATIITYLESMYPNIAQCCVFSDKKIPASDIKATSRELGMQLDKNLPINRMQQLANIKRPSKK